MTEKNRFQTMYVVSSGCYSDYNVLCICDSKKRARTIADKINGDVDHWGECRVESMPYVDYDLHKVTSYSMTAEIRDDGVITVESEHETEHSEWPIDSIFETRPVSWRWVRAPVHQGRGGRLDVGGTDLERVRRTYSDRKAQLLAEDAFRKRREASGV